MRIGALEVIVSTHLLPRRVKPYPRRLTTYKKRTLKRWARDPKHWDEGQIFQSGDLIMMHPTTLDELRAKGIEI